MWKKPTLVIDTAKVKLNIENMQSKAAASRVIFRPHFKTHQSAEVGLLFKEKGILKIAVSSVSMARFFARHGWKDITIAFPVNIAEIDEIKQLASQITLNLLVESTYSTKYVADHLASKVGIFIKIDTGYHRTGIDSANYEKIGAITSIIKSSRTLVFKGFLTHAGHTYAARSTGEIIDVFQTSMEHLNALKKTFIDDFPGIIISYGDTPSCALIEDFSGIDEVRPGNFVYFDVMQSNLGSCTTKDIAVAVACPVVATHAERNELVIYGGAVHLSKEFILDRNSDKNYGLVVEIDRNGWSDPIRGAYIKSLSQEHGIIHMPNSMFSKFHPGSTIGILPIHSCLTANLLKDNTVFL